MLQRGQNRDFKAKDDFYDELLAAARLRHPPANELSRLMYVSDE
jgi:hypothetical protein